MAKNEKKVQNSIINDLESLGRYCECFKIIKANKNGEPDVFFTTRLTGAVFIECKKLDGAARRLQMVKIIKLNSCGVKAFLCHSWEEWLKIKNELNLTRDSVIRSHNLE